MLTLSKVFKGNQPKTFSQENKALIKRAYPDAKGRELAHIQMVFDRIVSEKEAMRQRAEDHLRGRAFGFWGVVV